jgi:two-component system, cell cycle sensor histidine kinase and response regulator CckA
MIAQLPGLTAAMAVALKRYRDGSPACLGDHPEFWGKSAADSGLDRYSFLQAQRNAVLLAFLRERPEEQPGDIETRLVDFLSRSQSAYEAASSRKGGVVWQEPRTRNGGLEAAIRPILFPDNVSHDPAGPNAEQLRQLRRMEAIGYLASGIAHDFNNVLTVIQGYAELILNRLEADDPIRKSAEEIQKASDRASAMTHQLLDFSRKQEYQLKVVSMNAVIGNLEKMLRRLIGEDIELITILADDLNGVEADESQLEQILLNLTINARDAMPRGGKLTIQTRNVIIDHRSAHMHLEAPPGSYIVLMVTDTGCGMDKSVRARIFEPFFTTKERGTGQGLYTIHTIVKERGGSIWVYSEPGIGTTFKVYLPSAQGKIVREDSISMDLPVGTETILIAEDDHDVRELLGEMLRTLGYSVMVARIPIEALTIAANTIQPIHLLISDVVMPRMGGAELGRRLQCQHPEMKVLLTSGYTDSTISDYVVLDKDCSFLEKPFTLAAIANKVRKVLDS